MRKSGILMHITSLPSDYGIGTLGEAAFNFVDFLKASGQSFWQILPTNPTAFGNSPYQSPGVFAGNTLFIDLELLKADKLLTNEDFAGLDFGNNPERVDFEAVTASRRILLKKAFLRFEKDEAFEAFIAENSYWLDSYAMFMALKEINDFKPWYEWEENFRCFPPVVSSILLQEMEFHKFCQYVFYSQWKELKNYANKNGIKIIGDLPIYASLDSADVWSNKNLFLLNEDGIPTAVAGCPPDDFSEDGQLWGNPLYDWDSMKNDEYGWWVRRVEMCTGLFDAIRIDHFRGFEAFYAIPYGDSNAKRGKWQPGPGIDIFNKIKNTSNANIIAEDLGYLTEGVYKLLEDCGFPGMKVLQFGFDPYNDNPYLPHNYPKNCVAYTGTHDNDTCRGWYENVSDKAFIREYLNAKSDDDVPEAMIRAVLSSRANLAIIPIQDFLDIPGRMNTPSTLSTENWSFRIKKDILTSITAEKIRHLTNIYKRI